MADAAARPVREGDPVAIEVAALAASGATSTVVGLAVTEAWTQARTRLTRLFSRRQHQGTGTGTGTGTGSNADIEDVEQLRAAIEQLADSLQSDSAHAVGDCADQLRRRLRHALRQDSETARELVDLLSEMSDLAGEPLSGSGSSRSQGAADPSANSPLNSPTNSPLNSPLNSPISYHVPEALRRQGPPSQVPALRHHFINRSDELAVLNAQFDQDDSEPSHVDVRVLAGPPGVGKSALAHYWAHAHRTRERFSDGRLYVNFAALRNHTDAGADVTEAVGHCLRSLGVADAHLPPSLGERTALFRDRTADLRVLLVLDDVSSPAQVRALIPNGPGSAVLATSTGKLGELTLDGARPLPLEPLTEAAGLLLLADRCGQERVAADPEAARSVVGLCSGLPVALQVAAARLVNEPRLTLDALATELTDDGRRLSALSVGGESPVSAVLDSAYRQLSADLAHGYRLLGWIPGPTFDAATAAAAIGRDLESAQVLLDVLEDMSLVELTEERRYRFHGLVRLHARERAGVEERFSTGLAVTERVLTHYLILTALADRSERADRLRVADLRTLLAEQPDPFAAPSGPRPLDWLAAERANIMAVLRAADEPALHTHGWQLAECFTVLFLHHRHLGDWRESLELGARYASAAVAPAAEARLRSLLSRPLMDTGEHDRAQQELTTARSCAEIADDPVLYASVLEFSGRYWDRFDPDRAVAAYRRSMELNTRGGEPRGAAIAAFFLGRAQDARGDHDQAIDTLSRARTDLLALPTPDRRMAARATAALGRALDNLGRTGEAVPTLREAAHTLKLLKGHAYEAEALLDLVSIAERPGADRSTLRDDLARAVAIHADMGSPLTESLRERLRALETPGATTD